jgi:NtrC-family two-component system response regulator AlgB
MRILIVDDEASIRKTTAIAVQTTGHVAVEAPNGARALKLAETEGFDVCFLDVKLGAEDGLVVMDKLLQASPALAVVMFTAFASIAIAVEAMRRGAFDFIPKPFTPEQIRQVLQKIARTRSLEQRVQQLESQLADESPEIDFASLEPAVQRVLDIAFKAADTTATILILGPSGTGKNVLAREIHRRSAQRERPFVTVNCPSLSKELLESELFGHVKGAFTGAVQDTFGKIAAAEGGTLFLDEIGEMPVEIQPKLLRLLQEREYERVGEAYAWPGNLRELRNVIERAVILAGGDALLLADLPEEFSHQPASSIQIGARVTLDDLETEHIRRILGISATLEEAARTLGIDPATLYRKRQKLGLL